MIRKPTVVLAVGIIALGFGLAACSSGGGSGTRAAATQRASRKPPASSYAFQCDLYFPTGIDSAYVDVLDNDPYDCGFLSEPPGYATALTAGEDPAGLLSGAAPLLSTDVVVAQQSDEQRAEVSGTSPKTEQVKAWADFVFPLEHPACTLTFSDMAVDVNPNDDNTWTTAQYQAQVWAANVSVGQRLCDELSSAGIAVSAGDQPPVAPPLSPQQAQKDQQHAVQQDEDQGVQSDIAAAQAGDQVSDYNSALTKFRQDLTGNDCGDAENDTMTIVNTEDNAIDALEGDMGTDPSLDLAVKSEITNATAAVNQVIDQVNAITSQVADTNTCGLGPMPAFSPSATQS